MYRLGVAYGHTDPPASHVVALGEGVELKDDVFGAFYLQYAGRDVAIVGDVRVGRVVAYQQVVLMGKIHGAPEELQRGSSAGGVVGVVEPQHGCSLEHIWGDGLQVGQVIVFGQQGYPVGLSLHQHDTPAIGGVAGVGHQHHVARVHKGGRYVGNALFGADEGDDLGVGIQLDAETFLVIIRHGLAESRDAIVAGIAVMVRFGCRARQCLQDKIRRRQIGATNVYADNVPPFFSQLGDFLAESGKKVWRDVGDSVGLSHGGYLLLCWYLSDGYYCQVDPDFRNSSRTLPTRSRMAGPLSAVSLVVCQ